jgi:hypothetical protein
MPDNKVMWIRSQENYYVPQGLYPINMGWLQVHDNEIYFNNLADIDSYFVIGQYSTEERALKVLGEIENSIANENARVFYMPKE